MFDEWIPYNLFLAKATSLDWSNFTWESWKTHIFQAVIVATYHWTFQLNIRSPQLSEPFQTWWRWNQLIFKEDGRLILSRIKKWCLIKFWSIIYPDSNIPNLFKTCMVLWCCLIATFQSFSDVFWLWWYLPRPLGPRVSDSQLIKVLHLVRKPSIFQVFFCFAANISLKKKKNFESIRVWICTDRVYIYIHVIIYIYIYITYIYIIYNHIYIYIQYIYLYMLPWREKISWTVLVGWGTVTWMIFQPRLSRKGCQTL